MTFQHLRRSYRAMLDQLYAYVKRESGATGMYEGYEVWWGAEVENPDMTLDVLVEFRDMEGRALPHTMLTPSQVEAMRRGYRRLVAWREGGAFPQTVEELFAP